MAIGVRHTAAVALGSALIGFLACREPTQVTLTITTDAGCPADDLRPRLNDVMVLSGKKVTLGGGDLVPNASTDQCTDGDPAVVGTLVFLPDGTDDPSLEVLVVAGVQRDDTDDAESFSAGSCLAIVNDPDPTRRSIEGQPCIVARRRLAFVAHNGLALPINLDRRCIGQECGADLTCFEGNCVNPNVACDETGSCEEPVKCADDCDNTCQSGSGECTAQGICSCLACSPATCHGVCNDDQCVCEIEGDCSEEACVAACGNCESGQRQACVDGGCACACDPTACEKSCLDQGKPFKGCAAPPSTACECGEMTGEGGGGSGGGTGGTGATSGSESKPAPLTSQFTWVPSGPTK